MDKSIFSAIHLVRVAVRYPARALVFYRDLLKLNVLKQDITDNSAWIEFEIPGSATRLVLERQGDSPLCAGIDTGICFTSSNVTHAFKELTAHGVAFRMKPTRQPWGGTLARFIDLDSNEFQIIGFNNE